MSNDGERPVPHSSFAIRHSPFPSGPCDEGVVLAGKPAIPCSRSAEPWILAATILGSSMAFIDGTAVHLALPALPASPRATGVPVQLVVDAYFPFRSGLFLVC